MPGVGGAKLCPKPAALVKRAASSLDAPVTFFISDTMILRMLKVHSLSLGAFVISLLTISLLTSCIYAQGRGGAPPIPQTPKAAAPFDITGYWESIVTEDWRFRMVTPIKGDYAGVPLNAEGRKVADTWDPA